MKWKWLATEAVLLVLVAGSFWKMGHHSAAHPTPPLAPPVSDAGLVQQLLRENLDHRSFPFATVAEACSGKKVIPLGERESHRRVKAAIEAALSKAIATLNAENSPVRSLRRINEASRFFEDALHSSLDGEVDLSCGVPRTVSAKPSAVAIPTCVSSMNRTAKSSISTPSSWRTVHGTAHSGPSTSSRKSRR